MHRDSLKRTVTSPLERSPPETALRAMLLPTRLLEILPPGEREGRVGVVLGDGAA